MSDDFYEDDEPIEDVRAAWSRAEPGLTTGKKDLNQRARSVVDGAVERLERDEPPRYRFRLVYGTGVAPRTVHDEAPDAVGAEEPEYQFG